MMRSDFVQNIPLEGGHLRLWRQWLPAGEALELFEKLRTELAWEQSRIQIGGRQVLIPRLNAWYGDPGANYRYSGTDFTPLPWTNTLSNIKTRVEEITGAVFNSLLANLYRNGRDSVSWHSDDEPELGKNPVVASVSLSSERRFCLKHKRRKDMPRLDLWLPSGSLLLMDGATQHNWYHQLPKTAKPVGPRINLTFRRVVL